MKRTFSIFAALSLLASAHAEVEKIWQVAPPPLGSDSHDGSRSAPFATLERSRVAVRDYLARHELRGDLVVELRGGEYELAAPLRFDAADSGKNGFAVIYRSAPNETPVLSGGRRVPDWTRDASGVFRANVGHAVDFRQLWIDGRRAVRAREPNIGQTFKFASEKTSDGFEISKKQLANVVVHPNEVEFSVLIAWMHKRLRIARLAEGANAETIRAVIASPEWDAVTKQPQGDRVYRGREYWLENAREFLDAPGEFFLDRRQGALFYRPRLDENLSSATAIRPELENLVVLDGQLDAPVRALRFEGLTFAYTGWTRPNRFGFVDVQANSLVPAQPASAVDGHFRHEQRKDRVPAAFQAVAAENVVVRGCRFIHLGGTGVAFGAGSHENLIEGNSFFDLAGGGIEVGDDAVRPADARWFPRANRIANNFLAHLGEDYFGSVAILGYYTDHSVIEHNEIAALPYTAISQGWGWGQPPAPPESRANRILHNRISNFMRRVDDGGGIYTTDRQPGSEIAGNFIERMITPDPHTKAGGAIYLDQFTSGFHVHQNVITQSLRWLYIWNPNIRDNRVDTNYADTANLRNDGRDNTVEPVTVFPDRTGPESARAIVDQAGLEPAFGSAREFGDPRELVIENSSVDFQILAGSWATVSGPDSFAANCRESTDATARARWIPLVPASGEYELAVWLSSGSAAAQFTIRHADAESRVVTGVHEGAAGWHPLGNYRLSAGIGTEIEIAPRSTDKKPVVRADAIRLRLVSPQ